MIALLFWSPPVWARTVEGRVASAHDGDTITVIDTAGKKVKVRLLGIDAPEIGQPPWGFASRDFVRRLVLNKPVRIETDVQERDRYGRLLGYVYQDKLFINLELVRQGHAVLLTYPPNVRHVDEFTAAQTEAREAKRGIWSVANPLAETPHQFRHKNDPTPVPSGAVPVPAGTLAPDAPVVMNTKSKKVHHAGCGHALDCKHCEKMTMADAVERGGVPCKPHR